MYQYIAQITAAHDGDTITANIDLGFKNWRMEEKLRLFGINTPELRGDTMQAAIAARDFLRGLVLNKTVRIETLKDKQEKYGRYLAKIYVEIEGKEIFVNDLLVEKGFAVAYMADN